MPWNGSGVFARIYSWVSSRDAGLDILADRMDQDTDDIAQGLMHCLTVNGETTPAANLPMAGHRHTGASAGVADTDYATVGQVKNGGGGIGGGGFVSKGGDTMTGDLTVAGHCALQGIGGAFAVLTQALHADAAILTSGLAAGGGITCSNITASGALAVAGASTLHQVIASTGNFSGGLSANGITSTAGLNGVNATLTGDLHANDATLSGGLSVAGASALNGLTATSGTFSGVLYATSQITAQSGIRPAVDNGAACGVTGQAWSDVASHHYTTVSDRRLKRDLAPLPPAAGLVAAIAPTRFRWAETSGDGGAGVHWGFVAQEVEEAMAEAGLEFAGARRDAESGIATLDYNELLPVLWKAVQELAARLAALEAETRQRI